MPRKKKGSEAAADVHAPFRDKFLQFLNEFTRPGEKYPYYKARVAMIVDLDHYKFEVDFNDLKTKLWEDPKYLDLVFQIVNHQDSSQLWLKPVITEFIKNEAVAIGGAIHHGRLNHDAEVLFTNKPQRIRMLKDHLGDKPVKRKLKLLSEVTVESCTRHGRSSFLSVLCPLLMDHSANKSYGSRFGPEDIVVVDSKTCWILKTPQSNAQATDKSSDLQMLWTVMEEGFNKGGSLPLYMEDLKINLSNATPEEEWFPLYLEFHPALMTSLARRNFLVELNHSIHGKTVALPVIFAKNVPTSSNNQNSTWEHDIETAKMKAVYSEIPPFKKTPVQYDGTYSSQLLHVRHVLKHLNRQCRTLNHLDEIELYCSMNISDLMPRLLKDLLKYSRNETFFCGVFTVYKIEQNSNSDLPMVLFSE